MISSFVITGFLGVGKSTLLINSVKKYFSNKKVAVIVNEFGDVGVDGKLLRNVYSEVLEISEGCICCQLADEFAKGVNEIVNKHHPEILFVETSGASEPFPVFAALHNLGVVVEGVICVVDAKNFETYMENSTARYQVGGSNLIVINKTDLVNTDELEKCKQEVISIKKHYDVKNELTGRAIFKHYYLHEAEQGLVDKALFEGMYEIDEIESIAQEPSHDNHTKADSIAQIVAYLKENISLKAIDTILKSLPKNIYRVKGVAHVKDSINPMVINYSFGDVSYEPLPEYNEKSIMIFIGKNIKSDVETLSRLFDYLMLPQFRVIK